MNFDFLYQSLVNNQQLNLSISCRKKSMAFIYKNKIDAKMLLHFIYSSDLKNKIVLFHVLDLINENKPNYLNSFLDLFIEKSLSEKNESIKRCVSRILFNQLKKNNDLYNKQQKQLIIKTLFDWIILPSLVATRVNCIHALYFLIEEEDWIADNLTALIQQNIELQEASFVSRGKKILKLIHKQKS